MEEVAISAPATGANLGPGFDILGVAYSNPQGDIVIAERTDAFEGAKLISIRNDPGLPRGPANVVEAVANRVLEESGERIGAKLTLDKRIFVKGLGGSGSSSVASAVATNELLEKPFARDDPKFLEAIVYGEAVATGGLGHADNVLPSLLGGFVLIRNFLTYGHERFEGGDKFYFAIAAPIIKSSINTGERRKALDTIPYHLKELASLSSLILSEFLEKEEEVVPSSVYLRRLIKKGGSEEAVRTYLRGAMQVLKGIRSNDPKIAGAGTLMDPIVTPVRAKLIPGYDRVKDAALGAGAYGFSISGSGDAVFSITDDIHEGYNIGNAKRKAFEKEGIQTEVHVCKVDNIGAKRTDI